MALVSDGGSSSTYYPEIVIKVASGSAPNLFAGSLARSHGAETRLLINANEGIQNLGAVIDTYDPEWTAWLAGDI